MLERTYANVPFIIFEIFINEEVLILIFYL